MKASTYKRLLVCGGRDFYDRGLAFATLDAFWHKNYALSLVIHGACRGKEGYGYSGADKLAHEWATANGIQPVACEANFRYFGNQAGYLRNRAMLLLQPDYVIAFPGGDGTAMMIALAEKQNVPVLRATIASKINLTNAQQTA